MASQEETDLFMSVKLDGGGRVCNVVVTSQTTGQDVIECLKPDDDKVYYLVEVWKGCERPIGNGERLKSVLSQWGSDVDDVAFMLKRKHSSSRHSQKKKTSPSSHDAPVDFQDPVLEHQLKLETMQRVLEEKEQYLKSLRANEGSKNGLKTNYVRHLELKVLEQEEQLINMRSVEEQLFKYQVDNERLILELHRLRSLFALKHQQLTDATARVEILTKQLSHRNDNAGSGEEIPRHQEKSNAMQNEHQPHRNVAGQNDRRTDSLRRHLSGEHLTEAQLFRQTATLLHNKAAMRTTQLSEPAGNGGAFLNHVISKENMLAWQDDDENDTETSQDSGHVSVDHDSPSYQSGGMGPSFDFHGNSPGRYFKNVECFDMDQEFGNTNISLNVNNKDAQDGQPRYSHGSIPRTKNRPGKNIIHNGNQNSRLPVGQPNFKQPLLVQTDNLPKVLSPIQPSRTLQDSPQSTSSHSSQASQSSVSHGHAEVRERTKSESIKTSRKEQRNDTRSAARDNTVTRKEAKTKIDTKDTSRDRTLGSISLYQSNRSDSPALNDHISPQATDPKVEIVRGDIKSKEEPRSGLFRQPMQSAGVQDLLSDFSGLKMNPVYDTKPLQIQTRAEKDSENGTTTLPATRPQELEKKSARLTPKPLPRKRTKTPPARGAPASEGTNVVVTSTRTVDDPPTSSPEYSTTGNDGGGGNGRTTGVVVEKAESRKSEVESNGEKGRGETKVIESSLKRETTSGRGSKKSGKRVSLDPHAVLLHASLEGELELVKTIIHQVEDPSFPNTEGLTALHHAVCSSHDEIVKFLVEYGCDINAADMQGWTSLHCAAANNSEELCRFLVTHGACIFAVTAIEGKTPSLCCEKDVENCEECFSYLADLETNFGVTSDGVVYAVYAYQASRKDELSFECGERLTVVRRGDVTEKEWWWARDSRNQFGYIPRNLLALRPRIAPDV